MTSPARLLFTGVACLALLAGCGDKEDASADGSESDPALAGALNDEIMSDPELAGQNGGAVGVGSNKVELPPEQRSPEAIASAKTEAARLAGGSLQSAPAPSQGSANSLVEQAATAAQVAEAARVAKTDCSGKVEYSMTWAATLPAPLQVYPRGAVQEAAGTEKDGCRLRVVSFVTPVSPSDVVDFYYTRTRAAGYSAEHKLDGADHVLGGSKAGTAYLVYARATDNGLTEVDLIASGT